MGSANKAEARDNLELGTGDSPTFTDLTLNGDLTVDTDTLHVDSANNRVGVGTTSPNRIITAWDSTSYQLSLGFNSGASFDLGRDTGDGIFTIKGNQAGFAGMRLRDQLSATIFTIGDAGGLTIYDNITFNANSGTWNGATITGDQDFTGQLEATGQAASTDDSLMTRSLGDARYLNGSTCVKTSNQNKQSDTTVAADNELTFGTVSTGKYEVEFNIRVYNNSSGGIDWNLGGTATVASERAVGSSFAAVATTYAVLSSPTTGEDIAGWANDTRILNTRHYINVTASGTLAFEWAQSTSDATGTSLLAGSYMKLTRLD